MQKPPQYLEQRLLLCTIVLVAIGIVMVLSASFILAERNLKDGYYYFERQLVFIALGFSLLLVMRKIPYTLYARFVYPIIGFTFFLLTSVFVPGLGMRINGATRWINLGVASFQPSELAKIVIAIYMAYSLTKKEDRIHSFLYGFISHLIIPCILLALIIKEPDFGTMMIVSLLSGFMLFAGGIRLVHLVSAVLVMIPAVIYLVVAESYRLARIFIFLDPFKDPLGDGYQIIHAMMSFTFGGFFGAGLGAGQQKLFFLPDPHTDFIFAVIGEEMGLFGVALVVWLFLGFVKNGFKISRWAPDTFGAHLAFGLTLLIGIEAFVNMAVTLALLPTKGLPLPFISYGGSSIIMNLSAVGILCNIASQIPKPKVSKVPEQINAEYLEQRMREGEKK